MEQTKEAEIMAFLTEKVFDPILTSPIASKHLKQGVRYTIMKMNQLDAKCMVNFYWSAICGTADSIPFAAQMRKEGFIRFEDVDVLEEFRVRFRPENL